MAAVLAPDALPLEDWATLRPGDQVITDTTRRWYWSVLPVSITVLIQPENYPLLDRLGPMEWALIQAGVPPSEVPALSRREKPPTPRHRRYSQWNQAVELLPTLPAWPAGGTGYAIADSVDGFRLPGSFDFETDGDGSIVGVALADVPSARYIPRPSSGVLHWLHDNIERLVAHNAAFDVQVLRRALGVTTHPARVPDDTMLLAYLEGRLTAGEVVKVGLKDLAREVLGRAPLEYRQVVGRGQTWDDVPLSEQAAYAGDDARNTLDLFLRPWPAHVKRVYAEIEKPFLPVVIEMEEEGFDLDQDWLAQERHRTELTCHELASLVQARTGTAININSRQQVSKLLHEVLGLPVKGLTASGQPAVNKDTLTKYDHPVARMVRAWSLADHYLKSFLHPLQEQGARVHSHFNQCFGGGTRVLTAELRWEDIRKIRPGTSLLAFEETPPIGRGHRRSWVHTQVTQVFQRRATAYEVAFDDGTKVVATLDHPVLAYRGGSAMRWRTFREVYERGLGVAKALDVWSEPNRSYSLGWLGGFTEGEGTLVRGRITLAQAKGETLERLCRFLRRHGFRYHRVQVPRQNPNHQESYHVSILGGIAETYRFLGLTHAERLKRRLRREGLPNFLTRPRRIVAVRRLGARQVYNLETTSHTYIAEGLAVHNCLTRTGRLSSSDPVNLQNMPERVREAFVAPQGALVFRADYSQIELRIAAALSQDSTMLSILMRECDCGSHCPRCDLHDNLMELAGIRDRRIAKAFNFGFQYGFGAQKAVEVAAKDGITLSLGEARHILAVLERSRPGYAHWRQQTLDKARQVGYTETASGRRRYCPGIHSDNAEVKAAAERYAVNLCIQGTAADVVKQAQVRLQQAGIRQRIQVHDEVVGVVAEPTPLIRECMETTLKGVPLPITVGFGQSWHAARESV